MKKTVLLSISLFMSFCGFSQIDTISNHIYQSNEKLGIGTSAPKTQLHVVDSNDNSLLRVESSIKQAGVQLISNQDYKPFLNFGANGTPGSLGTIYYDINYNHIALRAQSNFDETKEMVLNDNGFVGIGTKSPLYKLDVAGDLNLTGDIYNNGELVELSTPWTKKDGDVYYNLGFVGIGTSAPKTQLHVVDSNDNSLLRVESSIKQAGVQLISNQDYKPFLNFGANGTPGSLGTIYYDINYNHIALRAQSNFDETKEMVLNDNGFVGIGTKSPNAKLEVTNGDIYINDIEKGIIMKSPDGKCWRGVLDNYGQLSFSSIDCPEAESNKTNNIEQDLKSSNNLLVYPNPSKNKLTIELSADLSDGTNYELYNIKGSTQKKGEIKSEIIIIDISELSSGTYFLSINNKEGDTLIAKKIIKQ